MNETLADKLVDLGFKHARKVIVGTKEQLAATFVGFFPGPEIDVFVCPWRDDIEKQIMVANVKRHLRSRNALAYGFVSEAWVATEIAESREDLDEKRKSPDWQNPVDRIDREEVVFAIGIEKSGRKKCVAWRIKRDWKGNCEALTLRAESPERVGGIMANLFEP